MGGADRKCPRISSCLGGALHLPVKKLDVNLLLHLCVKSLVV